MSCFLDTYADDDRSDDEMDILGLSRQDDSEDDQDSTEAQIREADRTDFPMEQIEAEHESKLQAKEAYRMCIAQSDESSDEEHPPNKPRIPTGYKIPRRTPSWRGEDSDSMASGPPRKRPRLETHPYDDKEAPIHLGHPVSFMRSSNARPHFLRQYPIFEQLVPLEGSEEIGDGISCPCSSPDHSLHGSRSNTPVRLQPPTATLDEIEAINYVEDLRSAGPMLAGIALDLYQRGPRQLYECRPRTDDGPSLAPAPTITKNCWARVRVPSVRLPKGRLAFADSDTSAIVLVERGDNWTMMRMPIKEGGTLDEGLELSVPTSEEVGVWDRVANEWLRYAVAEGPQLAFSPGFRVVEKMVEGEPRREGYITRLNGDGTAIVRRSFGGKRILQSHPDFFGLLIAPCPTADDEFTARLADLAHHLLRVPTKLHFLDRVVTSDGNVGGRVVWIDDSFVDPAVTVFGESGYSVFRMSELRRDFQPGDLVGVTAGRLKNEQGIVVRKTGPSDNTQRAVSSGGLEIFWAHRESHSLDNNGPAEDEELLTVLEVEVEFADGALLHPWRGDSATSPTPNKDAEALYRDDVLQRDRERRHARYIGMSVMLVGKHAKKGQYGVILDTHYDGPSRQEEPRLVLTVRDEASLAQWQAEDTQVVHRWSRRPIWEADYLEPWSQKLGWNWPARGAEAPVAPTDDADPEWAPEPQLLAPPPPPRASASLGEDGGRWLCIPGLVGKRVDVVLMLKMSGRSSGIQIEYAGHSGFIELEEPITEAWLARARHMKSVTVRIGPQCKIIKIEPKWLKPCRTTRHPPQVMEDVPITQCRGRVVIIGPDIDGDERHKGEYGETFPGNEDDRVLVSFARSSVQDPPQSAVYHILSLCRAYNADAVRTQRTIFI
ncbi:hypothetical protein B0H11DRAFT_2245128 [Mycena galericulata]|nr:hypothetical protein B0H11DRAFT_2245128 [Mycena galericulata]